MAFAKWRFTRSSRCWRSPTTTTCEWHCHCARPALPITEILKQRARKHRRPLSARQCLGAACRSRSVRLLWHGHSRAASDCVLSRSRAPNFSSTCIESRGDTIVVRGWRFQLRAVVYTMICITLWQCIMCPWAVKCCCISGATAPEQTRGQDGPWPAVRAGRPPCESCSSAGRATPRIPRAPVSARCDGVQLPRTVERCTMSMRIMAGESRLVCFAAYIRALHGALRLEAIAYLHRRHELLCATAGVRSCGIWDCMRMRGGGRPRARAAVGRTSESQHVILECQRAQHLAVRREAADTDAGAGAVVSPPSDGRRRHGDVSKRKKENRG